jgi:hypothetical protein
MYNLVLVVLSDMMNRVYDSFGVLVMVCQCCMGLLNGVGNHIGGRREVHLSDNHRESVAKGYHPKSNHDGQYLIGPQDGYDDGWARVRQGFKGTRSMGQETCAIEELIN